MHRGDKWHSMFRTSDKRYTSRPPANCRSARDAWDYHSKFGHVVWLRLLDGYWGAGRPNGDIDECENTFGANRAIRRRKAAHHHQRDKEK